MEDPTISREQLIPDVEGETPPRWPSQNSAWRPAERCCVTHSLRDGVRFIAYYSVIRGLFSMMAPLTRPSPAQEEAPTAAFICDVLKTGNAVVTVFSFFAGWSAIKGLLASDADRIKLFGAYYVTAAVALSLASCAHAYEICYIESTPATADLVKNCGTARLLVLFFPVHLPQALLFLYFAHVIYSQYAKMAVGGNERELVEAFQMALTSVQGEPSPEASAPWAAATPGEGHSLAEPAARPEAFSGPAFTLE